jgi:hypothetical protein
LRIECVMILIAEFFRLTPYSISLFRIHRATPRLSAMRDNISVCAREVNNGYRQMQCI